MTELTDMEFLEPLKKRLDKKDKLLNEQQDFLKKLEDLNEKLIASENLKSQFLSNIRNEINNPLTSIFCGNSRNSSAKYSTFSGHVAEKRRFSLFRCIFLVLL